MATVAKKGAPAAAGKKKPSAKAPEEKTFEDLLDESIDSVPEEPELPDGEYLLRVRAFTLNPKRGRLVMTLAAVEPTDGQELPGDIGVYRPVFQSFDPARAGDMRQLSEIASGAGVDVAGMTRREMLENKALVGVELNGRVERSPNANEPERPYINVRGLRVPE